MARGFEPGGAAITRFTRSLRGEDDQFFRRLRHRCACTARRCGAGPRFRIRRASLWRADRRHVRPCDGPGSDRNRTRPHHGGRAGCDGSGWCPCRRPGRLHLPARSHRHAHAPDHAAGGIARPQRELPPDRPATGRHLTRARPPDVARGVHHGARRRQLYGVGRQGDTRRDQSRRDAGAAHAGRRHLLDDSRRRRGPGDSRPSGVRDTCAGEDGRCAWAGAVPPEGRARSGGRGRSAEGDRFRSGVFVRRRHRATRR